MKKVICLALSALMLAAVGCGKNTAETSEVSATSAGVAVHVDYSKLTPYEVPEKKYTFHEGYVAGKDLAARDDYGVLLPYYGKRDWVLDGTCGDRYQYGRELYGFVTDKGELVTDPIYYMVKITDDDKFLIAYRGNPDLGNPADASESKFIYLIAAADGSWAHVFPDCVDADYNAGILLTCHNDGTVRRWNEDGEEVQCFDIAATIDLDDLNPDLAPEERWWPSLESGLVWSDAKVAHYGNSDGFDLDRYLIFETGEVRKTLPEGYSEEEERIEPSEPKQPEIENAWLRGHFIDPVTDALYFYGVVDEHDYYTLFDADGKVLIERFAKKPGKEDCDVPLGIRAGLCASEEGGRFCYRTLSDGTLKFCYTIQTNGD